MKKVIVLLILLLILLPFTYFAVKNNFFQTQNTGPITLNYWGVDQDEAFITPLIKKYQDSHPNIKVVYRRLSPTQYRETLQTQIKAGKGPDLFRFHNTWTPMFKDQLAPLPASVMDDKLLKSRFYPIVSQDLKANGKIVGVPLDFDGLALVYNQSAFSAAGYKNPPQDWFQFRQYAQKLTVRDENGQILVGGAAVGTSNNVDYFSDILGMMFLQNGTKMINKKEVFFDKTVSPDSTQSNLGADALTFYASFVTEDKVWDRAMPTSLQAITLGKAAMIFAPASSLTGLIDQARKANPPIELKVAPVPQLPNREPVTWGSFWAEGVSVRSKHQKEAWDFINFLLQKESLEERFSLMVAKNGLGMPYSRSDMKDSLSSNPYLGAYVSQAPTSQSWFMASRTFDKGINDKTISFFSTAVTSVLNNGNPKTALETAALGVGGVLVPYSLVNPPAAK